MEENGEYGRASSTVNGVFRALALFLVVAGIPCTPFLSCIAACPSYSIVSFTFGCLEIRE